MNEEDVYYFNILKNKVVLVFLKENSASNSVEDWKGEDIISFQEDLFEKVKGRVSEKWFYTYFKNTPKKLPRIDMLNLLCRYAGYKNWNNLKQTHIYKNKKKSMTPIYLWLSILIFILFSFFIYKNNHKNQFYFCFVDADKNETITNTSLDIKVLQENQSSLYFKTDSLGCFYYETNNDFVEFVIQSPYHKTDTIKRYIGSNQNPLIKIVSDDYALLLDYYVNGNTKNREKHKLQLHNMFADNAVIYQFFKGNIGVEIYTKEEFIRFTTIPTTALKRIKILEKKMKNGKIVKLKFVVK